MRSGLKVFLCDSDVYELFYLNITIYLYKFSRKALNILIFTQLLLIKSLFAVKYCSHQGLKGGTHIIRRKLVFLCYECISRNFELPKSLSEDFTAKK